MSFTLLSQARQMMVRVATLLAATLNTAVAAIEEVAENKADKKEIVKPETVSDGVEFKDGNGNVVYKISVMK